MRKKSGLAFVLIAAHALACSSPAPPPSGPTRIVLYHDPTTGAGWDAAALLATDPYDYPSENGRMRDAVERFLQDGILRMTGRRAPIVSSAALESEPPGSILIVLYPDAPAFLRDDPAIQAVLGRAGGGRPDYVRDRESYYLRSAAGRTWVLANTVDGLVSAMPALLGSKGYEVLGLGPNWIDAPDLHDQDLAFDLDEGHRNDGYYIRSIGSFGGGGEDSLVVELPLTPPDEDATRSYARWRVGTRLNAATSLPYLTGDAMESYSDAVLAYMREHQVTDGFLTAHTELGAAADRPPAGPSTTDWLWVDSDDDKSYWCDGASWHESIPQGVGFNIDVSTAWVREVILDLFETQSNADLWAHPDDWSVFATQPEDGGGFAHFAEYVHDPGWYATYRAGDGQAWGPYVLAGFAGITQETETYSGSAVSDTVFGFGNWLLREYDRWVDSLPPGPQTDPDVPTRETRSGQDRRTLVRSGISSYNFNDVPPHFNLDPRIRVIIAGYPKNRGIGEWATLVARADIAAAMQRMLPGEPIANYATISDTGWDPEHMSWVLPHIWGNSARSILGMFKPYTDAGVRSWVAETEMGYTQHALGIYLMSRYMWEPALDEAGLDALRDRWLQRAFGPDAWRTMAAYFDATEPDRVADVPNAWARAIDLLGEADALIPDGTPWQRRLDDVKIFWYFYYLMDTGQLVADNARTRELMWKGQSSYTVCNYELGWWVFGGQWLADMEELKSPVDYTAGPAHYTPDEIAAWWALARAHWPVTPVDRWADATLADGTPAAEVDLNDLVAVDSFRGYPTEISEALSYDAWQNAGTKVYTSAPAAGADVGFTLLWAAYDAPESQEYFGPHYTSYLVERWDTDGQAWQATASAGQHSRRLAAADSFLGQDAWLVDVREPAPAAGTYRITIGYGGIGYLGTVDWDVRQPPSRLPDGGGLSFSAWPSFDAQPDGDGMWVYLPKGVRSLDLDMIDWQDSFEKTVTFYRGLPLGPGTATRTVSITSPGTHRIPLEAGEAGGLAKLRLGNAAFQVPYLYSIPPTWARSPAALLVPRAVARADGLDLAQPR